MIFNPYNIQHINDGTANAASLLLHATPLLQDNTLLIGLIMIFTVVDLLSFCRRGVMGYQLSWITDTRSARTFESTAVNLPWTRPLLVMQVFLFFGLTLFCIVDSAPSQHLAQIDMPTAKTLILCIIALLGWYLLQKGLVNWMCYLFGLKEKRIIMNRSYRATFAVLAPFSMLLFAALIAGQITLHEAVILLAVLFILSQAGFIFSGFKIFYDGLYSVLLIFVYLCVLEIAPLWMIWARITTQQV